MIYNFKTFERYDSYSIFKYSEDKIIKVFKEDSPEELKLYQMVKDKNCQGFAKVYEVNFDKKHVILQKLDTSESLQKIGEWAYDMGLALGYSMKNARYGEFWKQFSECDCEKCKRLDVYQCRMDMLNEALQQFERDSHYERIKTTKDFRTIIKNLMIDLGLKYFKLPEGCFGYDGDTLKIFEW